jgi:hypothetical protein
MPRLSYYVSEDTHSTFVYMTLVMPRLSYYVSEDTHIVHLYAMSCVQMDYVCVFIDIIGQTEHYQCHVYKCTMCVSSLT